MIPKKFEYNPVRRDETESLVHKSVLDELEVRKRKLKERLATLKGTIQILCKQTRWVGGLGQILTFAHQVGGWVVPKCVAKNFLYKL